MSKKSYPNNFGCSLSLFLFALPFTIIFQEMKNTEGIFLDLSKIKQIQFSTKAFAKMKKLRLLKAYWKDHYGSMKKEYKLLLPQDFEFPS